MGKAPAFQLYAADLLTDVMDWTDEQVGVHIRLLCWSWVNRRGIPRDTQRLTRIAPGVVSAWSVVGQKWSAGPDDTWVNHRLEDSRANSDAFRASQRERSLLAVEARAKKKGQSGKPKGKPMGSPMGDPLEGEVEDEERSTKVRRKLKSESHEAEIEPTFKQWFDLYAKSRDKEACRVKWTALGQDIHEAIMDHTRRYVVAQPDKLYRKDPIRYLTKRGWEDEIVESKTNGTRTNTHDPDERRRLVIEANAEHFRQQREFEARHQPGGIPDPAHG